MNERRLRIDIWSDIACPWCYVGKRRLEAALARFPHADSVDIVWHAFELDPSAPRVRDVTISYAERLARKYRKSISEAEGMLTRMTETAASDGLEFHFERVQSGNTFDAHRVLHFAAEHGVQGAMKERLLAAYMTEGEAIGEPEVLVRLASEVGLDAEMTRASLASDAGVREVRADEAQAHSLGIQGVPFFVVDGRYGLSGAQPAELFVQVLEKVWNESAPRVAEGDVCGPDGCS